MKLLHFTLTIALFMALSCTKTNESNTVKEIYIDFDNIQTLDLSKGTEIELEFSDSSIIRSVDELRVYDKVHYLIRSRSDLFHFDANGSFKKEMDRWSTPISVPFLLKTTAFISTISWPREF